MRRKSKRIVNGVLKLDTAHERKRDRPSLTEDKFDKRLKAAASASLIKIKKLAQDRDTSRDTPRVHFLSLTAPEYLRHEECIHTKKHNIKTRLLLTNTRTLNPTRIYLATLEHPSTVIFF